MKLVIANNYGEDDQYARHTFYQQQNNTSSRPMRKLSCFIVTPLSLRPRITTC